jgi:hypothetical protein
MQFTNITGLNNPFYITCPESNGNIYILDQVSSGSSEIKKFDSNGNSFSGAASISVLGMLKIAIDSGGNNVYGLVNQMFSTITTIRKFAAGNNTQFGNTVSDIVSDIAVDSNGNVYTVDPTRGLVKYNSNGTII